MQLLTQVNRQVFREERSGAQVIPVRKATWNNEKMVVEQTLWRSEQVIDV